MVSFSTVSASPQRLARLSHVERRSITARVIEASPDDRTVNDDALHLGHPAPSLVSRCAGGASARGRRQRNSSTSSTKARHGAAGWSRAGERRRACQSHVHRGHSGLTDRGPRADGNGRDGRCHDLPMQRGAIPKTAKCTNTNPHAKGTRDERRGTDVWPTDGVMGEEEMECVVEAERKRQRLSAEGFFLLRFVRRGLVCRDPRIHLQQRTIHKLVCTSAFIAYISCDAVDQHPPGPPLWLPSLGGQ
jgi:hypothetical protein